MTIASVVDDAVALVGSQAELARQMGVAQSAVSRWSAGRSAPEYESCLRLAQLTGKPAAAVLRAAGHDPSLLPAGNPEAATEQTQISELAQVRELMAEVKRLLDRPGFSARPSRKLDSADDYVYQRRGRPLLTLSSVGT